MFTGAVIFPRRGPFQTVPSPCHDHRGGRQGSLLADCGISTTSVNIPCSGVSRARPEAAGTGGRSGVGGEEPAGVRWLPLGLRRGGEVPRAERPGGGTALGECRTPVPVSTTLFAATCFRSVTSVAASQCRAHERAPSCPGASLVEKLLSPHRDRLGYNRLNKGERPAPSRGCQGRFPDLANQSDREPVRQQGKASTGCCHVKRATL
jgi:hypothetical protein